MQRLTHRAQFEAVLGGGAAVSRTPHFVLHRASLDAERSAKQAQASPPSEAGTMESPTGPGRTKSPALFAVRGEPWIGAVIPKRWARRAVTRNAIRRQIYTVSQEFEAQMPAAAHVVRLRMAFDKTGFPSATSTALKKAVRAELQQLFAGVRR